MGLYLQGFLGSSPQGHITHYICTLSLFKKINQLHGVFWRVQEACRLFRRTMFSPKERGDMAAICQDLVLGSMKKHLAVLQSGYSGIYLDRISKDWHRSLSTSYGLELFTNKVLWAPAMG